MPLSPIFLLSFCNAFISLEGEKENFIHCFEGGKMKTHACMPIFVFSMLVLIQSGFISSTHVCAAPRFKVVVIAEDTITDQHYMMVQAAKAWTAQLALDSNIAFDWVKDPNMFTDAYLANYQVILQINYPPFAWNSTAEAAFQKYLTQGTGGWVGTHHASLYSTDVLGPGQSLFTFFQPLLGGITYQNYMAGRATGTVRVEDSLHPCMKNIPKSFAVHDDEWYTWSPDPRNNSNIHVIANVDESSYICNVKSDDNIKMGDHPVIWTNTSSTYKGRNIYCFMGHSDSCYINTAYTTFMRNSIFWAAATTTGAKRPEIQGRRTGHSLLLDVRTDRQFVSMEVPGAGNFHGILTDPSGRVLAQSEGSNGACRLERSRVGAGVYLVQAKAGEWTLTQRLFIN
jgi:uncharacterized protein